MKLSKIIDQLLADQIKQFIFELNSLLRLIIFKFMSFFENLKTNIDDLIINSIGNLESQI